VIGAGDYIGAAIAKKFAAEGFIVFAGRRSGEKLLPLVADIEAHGGRIGARSLDARKEEEITAFLKDADTRAQLEVCIFNIGANVNFALVDTTERVFRKVWEMACYSGFLAGREAARLMLAHGRGCLFFTGATASLRGGVGYAAFASAKFGLRAVAQSAAAGARAEKYPRCPSGYRRRGRHRMGARSHSGARRRSGAREFATRPPDTP
jgi:NAD(P)-dependent dehydrogenase (short-subunit alcohol dehydrogenase family)